MLEQMPNLRSFRWIELSHKYGFKPSSMLKNGKLLKALQNHENLRHFSVQLPDHCLDHMVESDFNNGITHWVSLKGFRNLVSLELYGIWADEDHQLDTMAFEIAQALSDNPQLRKLGLAMACEIDGESHPVVFVSGNIKFLESLCDAYESRCHSKPLALHTLRLGRQTFGYSYATVASTSFIEKLVQMEGLQTFHLFNGLVREAWGDEFDLPLEVDWIGMTKCQSLRQLSITQLELTVRNWLNTSGQSVEELIITDHYNMYDDQLNNFGALKLENLTMLFTRETNTRRRTRDTGWSEVDDWDEDHYDHSFSLGPSVKMDRAFVTVLDRLKDGGQNLTRLALCLDFHTQWPQFVKNLKKLKNLSQLRINARSLGCEQYPAEDASLWPGVQKPKDIAILYAKLAASICLRLRYIQIGLWSWEIRLSKILDRNGDISQQIGVRQLDRQEVGDIELFAICNFAGQGGLPATDCTGVQTLEDELDNLIIDVLTEARRQGRDMYEALEAAGFPRRR